MNDEPKVLPCPFCGAPGEFRHSWLDTGAGENTIAWDVACGTFDCYAEDGMDYCFDTKEEAATVWNKRTPNVAQLTAENERLKEALNIAANQLEGVVLAFQTHGQNQSVEFAIGYYTDCCRQAREALVSTEANENEN